LGSSSSDSDDAFLAPQDTFLNEAPPQYYDVVTDSVDLPGAVHQEITVSVNADTDVPIHTVSETYQPPQPQQQVPTSSHLE